MIKKSRANHHWPLMLFACLMLFLSVQTVWAAENFIPGETITVSATTSGVSGSFVQPQSSNYPDVMVTNAGTSIAFISCGAFASTSGLNATPVLSGETMVLRKGIGVNTCSAITSSSTATVYFTAGQGS